MADDSTDVTHGNLLRCPHCRGTQDVTEEEGIYEEGEHSIWCDHCEKEYEIGTDVSYTFISPALESEAHDE